MKLEVVGKNIEVTEGIRNAIENAVNELDKYFVKKELTTKVVVKTYPVGTKVEMTIVVDADHTLRQEVMNDDLYYAIDEAGKKMERQLRKFKERVVSAKKKNIDINHFLVEDFEQIKEPRKIIKRKEVKGKPMTEEEALLQFEILGHDFFVFEDFQEEVNKIIYRRKDNEYGIIVLK